MQKWYDDRRLVAALPLLYRGYARYSRLVGARESRRVAGGSFLLRMLAQLSAMSGASTLAPIEGVDGLRVYTDLADERVLDVIHEIRGENAEYQVLQGLLMDGDTFVDVGANFGTFSLLASRLTGKDGRVIAFEPQPHLQALIRQSLHASGISNCELRGEACSAVSHDVELLIPHHDSGRAGLVQGFSGRGRHDTVKVPAISLDAALAGVDLPGRVVIKIDVEGSELEVLRGARETIERWHPAMIIELNPVSAAAAGFSTRLLVEFIASLGYSSFSLAATYPEAVTVNAIPVDRQVNLVVR